MWDGWTGRAQGERITPAPAKLGRPLAPDSAARCALDTPPGLPIRPCAPETATALICRPPPGSPPLSSIKKKSSIIFALPLSAGCTCSQEIERQRPICGAMQGRGAGRQRPASARVSQQQVLGQCALVLEQPAGGASIEPSLPVCSPTQLPQRCGLGDSQGLAMESSWNLWAPATHSPPLHVMQLRPTLANPRLLIICPLTTAGAPACLKWLTQVSTAPASLASSQHRWSALLPT
jgi:hypothetical protein